jgi:hypothetical protein
LFIIFIKRFIIIKSYFIPIWIIFFTIWKFDAQRYTLNIITCVYNRLNPGKKYVLKYTTVSGVDGFDGSRKEAEKAVVKKID